MSLRKIIKEEVSNLTSVIAPEIEDNWSDLNNPKSNFFYEVMNCADDDFEAYMEGAPTELYNKIKAERDKRQAETLKFLGINESVNEEDTDLYEFDESEEGDGDTKICDECGGYMDYAIVEGVGKTLHEVFECRDCGAEEPYE